MTIVDLPSPIATEHNPACPNCSGDMVPINIAVGDALRAAVRVHIIDGDEDMWHGTELVDIHIYREDDDAPLMYYAYPVRESDNGTDYLTTDTTRLLESGVVNPEWLATGVPDC